MDAGTRLGHYEILGPLGAGGMGEVYRARDTRLDRDIAIKVLPEGFAADVERLARFKREAKLLAQLNHANIATIHGLEDADGVRFIAMECVEGETPPSVARLLRRCLAKDAGNRLHDIADARIEIGEAIAPVGIPVEARPRRRLMAIAGTLAAVAASLAILVGLNVGGLRDRVIDTDSRTIDSLAVLPLENLSAAPEQEYFVDGMTDALITELSKIEALKVISRTSSMQYKDTAKPLPQIGRELDVEGIVEGVRSVEVDPVLAGMRMNLGLTYTFAGRFDEAVAACESALELNPQESWAWLCIAWADHGLGALENALAAAERAVQLDPEEIAHQSTLVRQYAAIGRRDAAQEALDRLEAESRRRYVSPFFLAWIHTGLGNRDKALVYLDRAVETHAAYTPWINSWSEFDSLRSDPRFQELLRLMNLAG